MHPLEAAIGDVFAKESPELADTWREIKARGGKKSDCAKQIRSSTCGNPFMRSGLLIMLDRVWNETK